MQDWRESPPSLNRHSFPGHRLSPCWCTGCLYPTQHRLRNLSPLAAPTQSRHVPDRFSHKGGQATPPPSHGRARASRLHISMCFALYGSGRRVAVFLFTGFVLSSYPAALNSVHPPHHEEILRVDALRRSAFLRSEPNLPAGAIIFLPITTIHRIPTIRADNAANLA